MTTLTETSPGAGAAPLPVPEHGRWRRLWPWLLLALLVAAAGTYLGVRAQKKPAAPKFETAALTVRPIEAKVTATGTLSARVTVQVGTQVTGRVQALYADFNDEVKEGQLLGRIDPQLFQATLDQARAAYEMARGNLARADAQAEDAQRQLDRATSLRGSGVVAETAYEAAQLGWRTADAARIAARGQLAQAEANLRQAKVNLAYTEIHSPIDGVIISRNVDVGQTVAAVLQAPTLFVLAQDLRQMQVDTSVPEADVGRLTAGMPVRLTVDAWPGEVFHGTLRQVRNAPQVLQNVVTYDAVIDIANPDLRLKPGMTANVTFVYADRPGALSIANGALRFRPSEDLVKSAGAEPASLERAGDRRTVWLLRDERAVPVRLRVGVSDGAVTEVLEGDVVAGDRAITGSLSPQGPPRGAMF